MGTTTTPDQLYEPSIGETGWGTLVNGNFSTIQSRFTDLGVYVKALAYGAKGDGTTDDAAAIQAAHDALPSTGGAILLPGKFYIKSHIKITTANVALLGAGTANDSFPTVPSDLASLGSVIFSDQQLDELILVGTGGSTTIAAGSNGSALPQTTINVVSTTGFPDSGTLTVTSGAGAQTVTYTGKSTTTFTGCSGGTGTMSTGGAVVNPNASTNWKGPVFRNLAFFDSSSSHNQVLAGVRINRMNSGYMENCTFGYFLRSDLGTDPTGMACAIVGMGDGNSNPQFWHFVNCRGSYIKRAVWQRSDASTASAQCPDWTFHGGMFRRARQDYPSDVNGTLTTAIDTGTVGFDVNNSCRIYGTSIQVFDELVRLQGANNHIHLSLVTGTSGGATSSYGVRCYAGATSTVLIPQGRAQTPTNGWVSGATGSTGQIVSGGIGANTDAALSGDLTGWDVGNSRAAGSAITATTDLSASGLADYYSINPATPASTTIAAGSNGAALPQGTINVASTASFAASGYIIVTTTGPVVNVVAYTGKTGTTFTGCSGGTGTMSTGDAVASVVVLTMPLTVNRKGRRYTFKNVHASAYAVIIPSGSDVLEGGTPYTLAGQSATPKKYVTFLARGDTTTWAVVAGN